jgi:hypothetical protein
MRNAEWPGTLFIRMMRGMSFDGANPENTGILVPVAPNGNSIQPLNVYRTYGYLSN